MACVVVAVCVRACVCSSWRGSFLVLFNVIVIMWRMGELALSYTRQHLNVQWLGIVM